MATSSGKRTSSSAGKSGRGNLAGRTNSGKINSGKTSSRKTDSNRKKKEAYQDSQDIEIFHEIGLIILFVVMLVLFCCNFGIIGPVGDAVSAVLFGLFGLTAYAAPVFVFLALVFWIVNEGNPAALRKIVAGTVLFVMAGVVCELLTGCAAELSEYDIKTIYQGSSTGRTGGGVLAGSLTYLLHHYMETLGTVLVVLLCSAISLILLTEKSLIHSVKSGGSRVREHGRAQAERRREQVSIRRQEQERQRTLREEERRLREEERRLRAEEKENEKILRMEKKVSGVMLDTALSKPAVQKEEDIHEITWADQVAEASFPTASGAAGASEQEAASEIPAAFEKIRIRSAYQQEPGEEPAQQIQIHREEIKEEVIEQTQPQEEMQGVENGSYEKPAIVNQTVPERPAQSQAQQRTSVNQKQETADSSVHKQMQAGEARFPAKYMFPPLSRLQKGARAAGDSTRELKETAMRLQQTLQTFGVRVTITDISQGPSVTRYELQPEQGVKVSKIVGLSDDIKLNLAATDIRIEAPIPGKAAIGIEVPNKENMPVALRDLLESREFKEFPSKLAFAVGKDIAGKTVVADIAKMPHMLIAGATGSGKSVCINTLIMSILYKAHPDDVKLIMVDPKVVELSIYNGIPHLLIPVVTDPKKASAALHWGVSEMEDRYRKFADFNVRDLKGYNQKVEAMREGGDESAPAKMPQIVIIVDELADLMMVCPGEVEESICRLAQLARAAGIHLIIATQRPSVDVITGLIKANMPSRVAFSVSSGVDSRTILDMNGAEKLLGKGDMLFYPQGYAKPARIQGAFVSDKEVSDVVDFLKNQMLGNTYAEEIEEKIKSIGSASSGAASGEAGARDDYFEEAGRFIIDKDKASIGMLQRVLKIGFNRAARIMDQLCEYGVVGEEEGTKPRKILMSMEQFEQLLEEI